jgi:hypothetical protein
VQVALTAPTDGATVTVSQIRVVGSLTPSSAVLLVSGRRVRVVRGAFDHAIVLRKGLTHIRIQATAKGFSPLSRVISVRYAPLTTHQGSTGGGFSGPVGTGSSALQQTIPFQGSGQATGGPSPDARTEFMEGCSASARGNISLCACLFDRLQAGGFNTLAKWQALIRGWRREFLANGTLNFPPAIRNAIVGCVRQAKVG